MRVAITGASGLIGSALSASLREDGNTVLAFTRRPPRSASERQWDPHNGIASGALDGVDAVVHLAGVGVGDRRWNDAHKRAILESRVAGTRVMAEAVAEAGVPVLVSGSAIGYYGDTGDHPVDEHSEPGDGFLAQVVVSWEAAVQPAIAAGTRVAFARTGLVATADGGAVARLLPLFRLGLGGRLGSGRQYWSLISLRDEISALRHLIDMPLVGAFNLTAPEPVTNRAFTAALARALHRPALLPVPAWVLRLVIGEFASEILGSQRVLPRRLLESGFTFEDRGVDAIIRSLR